MRTFILLLTIAALAACARDSAPPANQPPQLRHIVLVTIDTLRADAVGAYGGATARTPAIDGLAREGKRFEHAFAAAPVTLPSHATIMTGRYPPGHGARHNGMRMDLKTPTLAETLARAGFSTGAFVAAFPLDRRFGLIKGFQEYGDTMPRDASGRPANERPGRPVVDEALAWISKHRGERIFLWVHLFEPHAPYGNPSNQSRSPVDRYQDDVAEADAQIKRLIDGLGFDRAQTLFVVAGDHGEAFGEHGEVSHSIFAYDTTLRVPLIFSGAGMAKQVVPDAVSLADVAPTIASLAGIAKFDSDGRILSTPDHRERLLYSETFAPLLDFGWSPLRAVRSGNWKYIAAPKPELYDLNADPGETRNVIDAHAAKAAELAKHVEAIAPPTLPATAGNDDREARARLQALGYASGRGASGTDRPDPKDRKILAAQIAQVTSGELQGAALERALRDILRADPHNPQANLRLGYLLVDTNRCAEATKRFTAAIEGRLPGADAHLGRASCEVAAKNSAAAIRTLTAAQTIEPDNPVVMANLGLVLSDSGQPAAAIPHLQRALTIDPELHQARFGLAIAFARTGRAADAAREADELLRHLQRSEVQRLANAVRQRN